MNPNPISFTDLNLSYPFQGYVFDPRTGHTLKGEVCASITTGAQESGEGVTLTFQEGPKKHHQKASIGIYFNSIAECRGFIATIERHLLCQEQEDAKLDEKIRQAELHHKQTSGDSR